MGSLSRLGHKPEVKREESGTKSLHSGNKFAKMGHIGFLSRRNMLNFKPPALAPDGMDPAL
jgi:hypothetical protein